MRRRSPLDPRTGKVILPSRPQKPARSSKRAKAPADPTIAEILEFLPAVLERGETVKYVVESVPPQTEPPSLEFIQVQSEPAGPVVSEGPPAPSPPVGRRKKKLAPGAFPV